MESVFISSNSCESSLSQRSNSNSQLNQNRNRYIDPREFAFLAGQVRLSAPPHCDNSVSGESSLATQILKLGRYQAGMVEYSHQLTGILVNTHHSLPVCGKLQVKKTQKTLLSYISYDMMTSTRFRIKN